MQATSNFADLDQDEEAVAEHQRMLAAVADDANPPDNEGGQFWLSALASIVVVASIAALVIVAYMGKQ